ncbi:MAG TPA: hypothetical protein VFX92_05575 [Candidatus Krumholzibacteria bacterium]|nr:hypothetical protein [Candidatus Krumholzibacteria bacterium]
MTPDTTHRNSARPRPALWCARAACVGFGLLAFGCGTTPPVREGAVDESPAYTMVFVIHGDGNYHYHDDDGNDHAADRETVAKALAIARDSPRAEVMIFHESERRHVLFFIPRHDGRAYHYRNGRLIAESSYWRDQGVAPFDPEVRLYHAFSAGRPAPPLRLFLYFGHELPELGERGYDVSYPERTVTIDDLADGMEAMAGDSTRFDLVILGTCYGGTPRSIGAIASCARYVVASPDNLHLSYFDLEPLRSLDDVARRGDVASFADHFARNAFMKLSDGVQTGVSVAVYDIDLVHPFVQSVTGTYNEALLATGSRADPPRERCDCAEDARYRLPGIDAGVTMYYRSPRFGRQRTNQEHSGWECWRVRAEADSSSASPGTAADPETTPGS